jgi:hypothetical protein
MENKKDSSLWSSNKSSLLGRLALALGALTDRIGRKGKAAFVTENEKREASSTAVGDTCIGTERTRTDRQSESIILYVVNKIQKLSSHLLPVPS